MTERGIGPLVSGMTVSEVSAILGHAFQPVYDLFDYECDYVEIPGGPSGVMLMIVSDTLARVDVDTLLVATAEGVRLGELEQRVLELYRGRVEVEPHAYTDGHYLVVSSREPADSLSRMIFETYNGQVVRFRSGRLPAVAWIEGCA